MIINKKKNLYKELLKIRRNNKGKTPNFAEHELYTIHNVFIDSGFDSLRDFKEKYRKHRLKKFLNKPVYKNVPFLKTFKAGIVEGVDQELWLEKIPLMKYGIFVNEPVNTKEKCSFIYACELLSKNEKIFYVIDDNDTFEATVNFINEKKINHTIINKICFNIFNMDDYFYVLLDLLLSKSKFSCVKDFQKRHELYGFFFSSDYKSIEFSKEAIDKLRNNERAIFPCKNDEEKEMYDQIYNALVECLDEIYPFLSDKYCIEEDVFLNMQKGESFLLDSKSVAHSSLIIQCSRFFYGYIDRLQNSGKLENQKTLVIPHMIIPDVEDINQIMILKHSYLMTSNSSMTLYYGNQENYLFRMNTGFYFKHKSGTLYEMSSFFDKNIVVDVSEKCSCLGNKKRQSFLFEK